MLTDELIDAKIGVKLKIMKKRMKCLLIQIHYLKNTLLNDNSFFSKLCVEPSVDQAIKVLIKKFPNFNVNTNKTVINSLTSRKVEIIDKLQFHYNTLTDVLEIKDNVINILGEISALHCVLDIKNNTYITQLYLDVVINYIRIMIMLSGVPQVRLILIVYNLAFASKFDQDELLYHRLCEHLVEKQKDGCLNVLHNELYPYSRVLLTALQSVSELMKFKLASPVEWEKKRIFEIVNINNNDEEPIHSSSLAYLITFAHIHRWILLGYLINYPEIVNSPTITLTYQNVLNSSSSVVIFRDELLNVHSYISKFFANNQKVLLKLVKDSEQEIDNNHALFHRVRRSHLKLVMHQQLQALVDTPGIMGPTAFILCHTLTLATDEVYWFITNIVQPVKKKSAGKINLDDMNDREMPEFLYLIEEIRYLITRFGIVEEYHRKLLLDHDFPCLYLEINTNQSSFVLENVSTLTSILDTITLPDLNVKKPYKGLRLDSLRLQTLLLSESAVGPDMNNILTNTVLHTHLVDNLPKYLNKFSSLKAFFFHQSIFQNLFFDGLRFETQHRYIIVFPRICSHFLDNCTSDCPEDFNKILNESSRLGHSLMSLICQELCKLMAVVIKSEFQRTLQNQAINAVNLYDLHFKKNEKQDIVVSSENRRKVNELNLSVDHEINTLNQLSEALNSRHIFINNHAVYPPFYLKKEIIIFLTSKIVSLSKVKFVRDKHEPVIGIRRPSEMKALITECLSVVSRVSEHVDINSSQIFQDVFINLSLPSEFSGQSTLADVYTHWYLTKILAQQHILHSPLLKCFVTVTPSSPKDAATFFIKPEEFTDICELQALAEIMGPFGMHHLDEEIMNIILYKIANLRKFVQCNHTTLVELNVLNLEYPKIRKLLNELSDVENFSQSSKQIGILFAFKELCREAVQDVTRKSVPFLRASVEDLEQDLRTNDEDYRGSINGDEESSDFELTTLLGVNRMCQGFGIKTKINAALLDGLRHKTIESQELQGRKLETFSQKEDLQNELIIVALGYLLPNIVGSDFYRVEYQAIDNNAHCVAYTIKELIYAFFGNLGENKLELAIRKFIGLTSSNLLRLSLENNIFNQISKEEAALIINKNTIYILFDYVIQTLENVSESFYEECFPYALVRQAYHDIVKQLKVATKDDVLLLENISKMDPYVEV